MKRTQIILSVLMVFGLWSCNQQGNTSNTEKVTTENPSQLAEVASDSHTDPFMLADTTADPRDVCIWRNTDDPSKSLVVAAYGTGGLIVYDLKGKEITNLPGGDPVSLDTRSGFPFASNKLDIIAVADPSIKGFNIYTIDPGNVIKKLNQQPLVTGLTDVTGICLYHDQERDMFYTMLVSKSGKGEQYRIYTTPSGNINAEMSRQFSVETEANACAADDDQGYLYISEKKTGIWRAPASPDQRVIRVLIAGVGTNNLSDQVGDVTVYHQGENKGCVIVSSPGNQSLAMFDRVHPNKYLGSISVKNFHGTYLTSNGIGVCSKDLGREYPDGILVATHNSGNQDMNVEMVSWKKIQDALNEEDGK